MKKKILEGLAIGLFIVGMAGMAQASTVSSAVGVTSNSFGNYSTDRSIDRVSDQSGLSATFTSGVTDWDTYFSTAVSHNYFSQYEWFGPYHTEDNGGHGTLVFDLGGSFTIDKIAMWNEDIFGIITFDVYTSNDGLSYTAVGSGLTPTNNTDDQDYTNDIFTIDPSIGRYVKLDITSYTINNFQSCSMGEIAFSTVAAAPNPVPVPSSIILLASGILGLAGVPRKKK